MLQIAAEAPMTKTCAWVVAVSLAGCMGTGEVEYAGEVRVTSPDLIEISPGVQVIADADEPIFYSHGDYWLYRDGYWLRSNDYRRGYARVEITYVPQEVRVIERPQLYVQYRRHYGANRAARTPDMRRRSQPAPHPVPHRTETTPPVVQPTYPPPAAQQPAYRDPAQPATSPASPVYQPNRPQPGGQPQPPGSDPTTPTPPPGATSPVVNPNDHRREPAPQRAAPPEIDRTAPDPRRGPPDHAQPNRPEDRHQSARERERTPDRPDRATPPTNKTDDRTKKDHEHQDHKDKRDK
jgi:hypothetical protein